MKYIPIAIAIIIASYFFTNYKNTEESIGINLAGSGAYQAYNGTTTDSTWDSPNGQKIIKTGPGILHYVTITDSTAGTLSLYDGTTTISHANHPTTTLAVIAASAAETGYPYHIAFSRGLLAVWSSTAGGVASSTIISE